MLSDPDPFPSVVTLLDSVNPYGSRRLTVEFDGTTTAAYLRDETTVIAATWIANHVRAPQSADPERINAGHAPVMPAGHTKHPRGRPPLDPAYVQALWFEEGDGVALLEGGTLLAVIPGWADSSRGMPGYSRDVIGQTPYAWALDDAWRAFRETSTTRLRRPPSELLREHVWFTTQPIEEPDDPEHLAIAFDALGMTDRIMFSSDYPHWDFDAPSQSLPPTIPRADKARILAGNACRLYGLDGER